MDAKALCGKGFRPIHTFSTHPRGFSPPSPRFPLYALPFIAPRSRRAALHRPTRVPGRRPPRCRRAARRRVRGMHWRPPIERQAEAGRRAATRPPTACFRPDRPPRSAKNRGISGLLRAKSLILLEKQSPSARHFSPNPPCFSPMPFPASPTLSLFKSLKGKKNKH